MKEKNIDIAEEVNAVKETISGEQVWDLIRDADKLIVASGKKISSFADMTDREEILARVKGRSGNLRAPTLRVEGTYFVGYNEELYRDYIG